MKRIISINSISIDLGNIKSIRVKNWGSNTLGQTVIVDLLKGKEYVYNKLTGDTKLLKSQIREGFSNSKRASCFVEELETAWNEYLTKKQ